MDNAQDIHACVAGSNPVGVTDFWPLFFTVISVGHTTHFRAPSEDTIISPIQSKRVRVNSSVHFCWIVPAYFGPLLSLPSLWFGLAPVCLCVSSALYVSHLRAKERRER